MTKSFQVRSTPACRPIWPATRSSPGMSYFPPQPLNLNAAAVLDPAPKIGPVSRSQTSPNSPGTTSTFATPAKRAWASARTSALPTISLTCSRPGPAKARTRPSTSSCACSSASNQYSAWLGQPTHMARCGAHSAGMAAAVGSVMQASSRRAELGAAPYGPKRPRLQRQPRKRAARERTALRRFSQTYA